MSTSAASAGSGPSRHAPSPASRRSRSPEQPSDGDVPARLRLATTRLARRLRQESSEAGGLTPTLLAALATIESRGPLSLGELAEAERIQPPTVTRIATRLSEQGLIVRTCDSGDRRVSRVEISDAGREVLARTRSLKDAYLARRLDRLSAPDRDTVVAALTVLERLLEDDEA